MTLTVATAGSGVPRTAHYIVPTGGTVPIQTLLLEPQRTNLCIRSEEFNQWTGFTSGTATANTSIAPDGATTADTITSGAIGGGMFVTLTFTGDGEKCAAVYLKAGTSARSQVAIRDATAATDRHRVRVTWTANVPTLTTESGAGTIYPVEPLANGWYRILFSATNVVAANSNNVQVVADALATGTVFAWGAQVEDAVVPSSYIKTEATTITRSADSLYFPFTAAPQAMTVYHRQVHLGAFSPNTGTSRRFLHIGASGLTESRFSMLGSSADNALQVVHDPPGGAPASNAGGATVVALREIVESRAILRQDGSVVAARTVGGGPEVIGAASAAEALDNAWNEPRLWLAGMNTATAVAVTHVLVAQGEQSLATMRQLAGVV